MQQLHFVKLLFIILFASMIACTSTQRSDELASGMSNQQITDSILNKMNIYADALNRLDSAAWIDSYVASDEFRAYSDGKVISYEEMKTSAGELKNVYSSVHVSWDTILLTLPSNSVALATAPFHERLVDKVGTIIYYKGVANWLFVFRNGQWKMLYGHGDHQPDSSGLKIE